MTQQILDLIDQAKAEVSDITAKAADVDDILTQIAALVEQMQQEPDPDPEPEPGVVAIFREYGFTLSNGSTGKQLNITAGAWLSDDPEPLVIKSEAGSVDISTSGLGGLDTGSPVADTTYHVFALLNSTTGDVGFIASASPSSPILPAGYDHKVRLGSIPTDSSANFIGFTQRGNEFLRMTPLSFPSISNPGTSGVLRPAGVPTGIKVNALMMIALYTGSTAIRSLLVTSPDQTDEPATGTRYSLRSSGLSSDRQSAMFNIRTDTSGQIRTRLESSDASTSIFMTNFGWIDERRCL